MTATEPPQHSGEASFPTGKASAALPEQGRPREERGPKRRAIAWRSGHHKVLRRLCNLFVTTPESGRLQLARQWPKHDIRGWRRGPGEADTCRENPPPENPANSEGVRTLRNNWGADARPKFGDVWSSWAVVRLMSAQFGLMLTNLCQTLAVLGSYLDMANTYQSWSNPSLGQTCPDFVSKQPNSAKPNLKSPSNFGAAVGRLVGNFWTALGHRPENRRRATWRATVRLLFG